MSSPILQPVIALAAWTMVVWLWLYVKRIPAMQRAGMDATKMVGTTGRNLRDDLVAKGEAKATWVADNYNHLHEAPTVFYAVAIVLALTGGGDGLNALLAWAYVALRVAHSVVQITINRVIIRFVTFALSSLCLIAMTLHAAMTVF